MGGFALADMEPLATALATRTGEAVLLPSRLLKGLFWGAAEEVGVKWSL